MKLVRISDLRVGGLYSWEYGDPEAFFMVLEVPNEIEPIKPNHVEIICNKFPHKKMIVFSSDRFYELLR